MGSDNNNNSNNNKIKKINYSDNSDNTPKTEDKKDFSCKNINLMMNMTSVMPHKFPQQSKKLGNNVIYYDPYFDKRPSEIYKDAEIFKIDTSGAFILVMNMHSLFLVLKEIEKLETNCKFDLISTGKPINDIFNLIEKHKFYNIFKRCCIFTYNPQKYLYLTQKYNLIKGVYYTNSEVLSFLRKGNKSTPILRTLRLVTLEDYNNDIKNIHFLIAKHYNNFSKSNYDKAIEKVKKFMDDPDEYKFRILNENGEKKNQKETMIKTLKIYEDIPNNYKNIITNYTMERCSIYKDFNYLLLRLNKKGIEAFGYFMAGLIYSLNKFNGGENTDNRVLYRGMRLDMTELLNYERYEGSILCFPSFTSTSKISDKASIEFGGRNVEVPTREKEGLFSVVLTINYNYTYPAIPNGTNIESISAFENESECLLHPFSFFKVKKVAIDLDKFECDIDLDNYPRRYIFEERIKNGHEIDFYEDYIQI